MQSYLGDSDYRVGKNGCLIHNIETSFPMSIGLDVYQECGMIQYKYGGIRQIKIMDGAGVIFYLGNGENDLSPYKLAVEVTDDKSAEERERIVKDVKAAFDRIHHSQKEADVCIYTDQEMTDRLNEIGVRDNKEIRDIEWILYKGRVVYKANDKILFPYDMDFEWYMKEYMKA